MVSGGSGQAGYKRFVIGVSMAGVAKVRKEWVLMDEHEKTYINWFEFLIYQLSFSNGAACTATGVAGSSC